MAKRTKTMVETIREGRRSTRKPKKPRTSTINETIATASQGFKPKKKATKTRTMVQTIKEGSEAKPARKAPKSKKPAKTKKVSKRPAAKKGGRKSKK